MTLCSPAPWRGRAEGPLRVILDNLIEAFADTLERHGIDVFELEGL
ncbi:hypothetical protein GCM10011609_06830 [Lentzea pudingi]|uniref:Uncharacterized protein n=1 Tax=Lentzea pudingi TaxID=1789439 RepID=A0ABQ2HAW0_9PSEU|nr:hypothetical protein [Lentzea pudingi]GGM73675.1 hypothetical protein GCM10011609_06830 [Lentzea pudingi]